MNSGGSYLKQDDREILQQTTISHPEGDRARNADGQELRQLHNQTVIPQKNASPPKKSSKRQTTVK